MEIKDVVRSQYRAALEMLKQAIAKCPASLWDDPADATRFWHIAYHALFYTHLYLQDSRDAFRPWVKHKEKYESLDAFHGSPEQVESFSQADLLEYLELCQQQVEAGLDPFNAEAASGFFWLPCSKLELQFYNIRHLQQHIGELMERLGTRAHVEVGWVGMKPD